MEGRIDHDLGENFRTYLRDAVVEGRRIDLGTEVRADLAR